MDWVFRSFPLESIRFFRKVILFGFVMGTLTTLFTVLMLQRTWEHEASYNFLLRGWLLMRVFVFVAQLPLRAIIYFRLEDASTAETRDEAIQQLLWLCRSNVWKMNQMFGIFLYAWFGFAFLFVYAANGTGTCFTLSALVVANIACFFLHMALSFFWFKSMLNQHDFEAAMWKRGAPLTMIDEFTQCCHLDKLQLEQKKYNSQCPICFEEFKENALIRILPCQHHFHQKCIDPWLTKYKKVCPLCQRKIDGKQNNKE